MKCQNCGNEITDNQKFCSNCGKELNNVINKKLSQEELEQKIIEYKDNISQAVYLVQSNLNYDIANARKYVDRILIKNGISSNNKTTNTQSSNTDKFYIRIKKFFKYAGILAIILFAIAFIGENRNSKTSNTDVSELENQTPEQLYNSTEYENSVYGEKVVKGYCNQYGSFNGIGKITSITKSTFLEKDGQGRFAFEVSFKYNPTNGNGDTMLDRESSMSVYAIYIVNPDDPYGTYTGISSVHYKRFGTWEKIKKDEDLCYGAWGNPLTVKYN